MQRIGHYWTDEWLNYVCEQSIIYAEQKSLQHDCVSRDNLRVFFGILILSGYNKLANRRLYWTQQVAAYRIRIRSKKWWWPLFAWSLNA